MLRRAGSGGSYRNDAMTIPIPTVRAVLVIAAAYKRTFDQQSVLRAIETVCAAF